VESLNHKLTSYIQVACKLARVTMIPWGCRKGIRARIRAMKAEGKIEGKGEKNV